MAEVPDSPDDGEHHDDVVDGRADMGTVALALILEVRRKQVYPSAECSVRTHTPTLLFSTDLIMLLSTFDVTLLGIYLVSVLAFGVWSHFRSKTANSIMDGDRNMSAWAIGFSLFSSGISSIALMSFPALAYDGNLLRLIGLVANPVASLIAARFFVDFFRKKGYISGYSHYRETAGAWAPYYAAGTFVLLGTIRIGVIMHLTANAFSVLLGVEETLLMIITGAVVTVYTFLGGIRAVILTDVLQGILMIVTLGVILVVALQGIPMDGGQILEFARTSGHFEMGDSFWSFSSKSFLVFFVFYLTDAVRWRCVSQNCVQRYMVAKDDKSARSALWINVILDPIAVLTLFAIGGLIFVFYQMNPEALSTMEALPNFSTKSILPYFIATHIPQGLVGVLIVAILAAAMSSIDTTMNSSATLVFSNFVKPLGKGHIPEHRAKRILSATSILQGIVGIGVALQFADVKNVYESFLEVLSLLSGILFGIFLIGFFLKKVPTKIALTCTGIGILCTIWLKYSGGLPESLAVLRCPVHPMMANFVTTSVMLFSGVLLTWGRRKKQGKLLEASESAA